jgi:Tol biopolymer transport system component
MRLASFLIFLAFLFAFSCSLNDGMQPDAQQDIRLQFTKSANIQLSSAYCQVSADDMDTLAMDLEISETLVSGLISNVPIGQNRKFEIFCYDNDSQLAYYGFRHSDIGAGIPIVEITVYPVQTHTNVSIIGHISSIPPTEEKIVFQADWSGSFDIYMMDVNGTNIQQLTATPYNDYNPQLSPDRSQICFTRIYDGYSEPILLNTNDLSCQIIPTPQLKAALMTWHPSGTKIIFYTNHDGDSDIYSFDLLDSTLTNLIQNDYTDAGPSFSHDGENILFFSNMTGIHKAYIADADGSNISILLDNNDREERMPKMNPQNPDEIVFTGRGYSANSYVTFGLFKLNRETKVVSDLISTSTADEQWAEWSPDGNTIVFESGSQGTSNMGIYTIKADGTGLQKLLDIEGSNEGRPHWR